MVFGFWYQIMSRITVFLCQILCCESHSFWSHILTLQKANGAQKILESLRNPYPSPCFNRNGRRQTSSKTGSRHFVPAQYWRNRAIKRKLAITIHFNILGDNYIVGDGATSGDGLLIVISRDGVNPALLLLKVVSDFLTSLTDLLLMIIMDIVVIFLQAGRN